MPRSCGLIVISPAGELSRYADVISPTGEDAPSIMDINGATYGVYRCTLFRITGRSYGFVAALTPPTKQEFTRAATELFGEAFGILRFQPVVPRSRPE